MIYLCMLVGALTMWGFTQIWKAFKKDWNEAGK